METCLGPEQRPSNLKDAIDKTFKGLNSWTFNGGEEYTIFNRIRAIKLVKAIVKRLKDRNLKTKGILYFGYWQWGYN